MFYCNDCADKNDWPKTVGNSLRICECCKKKTVCNCMQSSLLPKPKPQNNITDMYQDRSEDLDSRVSKVLNEAPKILSAIEKINDCLKDYYDLKEQTSPLLCGFKRTQTFFNHIDDSYLKEGWDYTKEFEESLQNLNESVLDAYIVFLEAEREALIKRWNKIAKELKLEK